MDVQALHLIAADLTVAVGAVLQASTGLGAGLLIVPVLALIDLNFVPGPVIFASLVLSSWMTYTGWTDIRRIHLQTVSAGLLMGMLVGFVGLSLLPPSRLGLLFGVLVLLAVAISACGLTCD